MPEYLNYVTDTNHDQQTEVAGVYRLSVDPADTLAVRPVYAYQLQSNSLHCHTTQEL